MAPWVTAAANEATEPCQAMACRPGERPARRDAQVATVANVTRCPGLTAGMPRPIDGCVLPVPGGQRTPRARSTQVAEELDDVAPEELGLLVGGEVAAAWVRSCGKTAMPAGRPGSPTAHARASAPGCSAGVGRRPRPTSRPRPGRGTPRSSSKRLASSYDRGAATARRWMPASESGGVSGEAGGDAGAEVPAMDAARARCGEAHSDAAGGLRVR